MVPCFPLLGLTPSGLFMGLSSTIIYTSELILCSTIGIFRLAETLREEIVSYLESHPNSPDGTPMELFAGIPWDQYLGLMVRDGTYGDHLTLKAASDVFNIQIVIYSTLSTMATQTISPMNRSPTATFYLGHFAEGAGEHYVCLADESGMKQFRMDPIQNPGTEQSCLSPAQEEQAQLDSASDINMKEDQSHNNIDQHAPDISTTHRNRTGLLENEQKDMTTKGSYPQM